MFLYTCVKIIFSLTKMLILVSVNEHHQIAQFMHLVRPGSPINRLPFLPQTNHLKKYVYKTIPSHRVLITRYTAVLIVKQVYVRHGYRRRVSIKYSQCNQLRPRTSEASSAFLRIIHSVVSAKTSGSQPKGAPNIFLFLRGTTKKFLLI